MRNNQSLPKDFDENGYLSLNPDVKAAGVDPKEHYLAHGISEGRQYKICGDSTTITMSRNDKILHGINRQGWGLEIGPSHNPIAPKKDGFKVHVIDCMSRDELLVKYKDHPVNHSNIEEVDFIWRGENYQELTKRNKYYDWIISSHSIEHTPDFIGFLQSCDQVLKDDGVLSLAIPDKRFCFDHFRPLSGIGKIIDSHIEKRTIHSPGNVAEFFLNVVRKNELIAWGNQHKGSYSFMHTVEDAYNGINSVCNDNIYLDIHAWCFVPHSFRLLIHDLYNLGFIPFKEVSFFPTEGCEFFITLGRQGDSPHLSRLELLEIIQKELTQCR